MSRRGDPRFSRGYRRGAVLRDSLRLVRSLHVALALDAVGVDAALSVRGGRCHRDPVDLLVRLDREAWRPSIAEQSPQEMIDMVVLGDLLRGLPVRIGWHRRRGVRP